MHAWWPNIEKKEKIDGVKTRPLDIQDLFFDKLIENLTSMNWICFHLYVINEII